MENFGKFCFIGISLFASAIVGGWVFQNLWEWFIVSKFNVPTLSLPQAIGISFTVRYLTARERKREDVDIDDLAKQLAKSIALSLVGLGIAWIITLFM